MKSNKLCLEIALREIDFLLEQVYPLAVEIFDQDAFVQRAAVLSIIIIGEETNKVSADTKAKYPNVPWRLMAAMRNKIVHHYDGMDTEVVWNTIRNDIPELKFSLEIILAEDESNGEQ